MRILALVLLAIVAAMMWIRFAPSDPDRWNKPVSNPVDGVRDGSVLRILPGQAADMAAFERIIQQTPRTRYLAGSVDEGMFTYVTRSALFGFPDYATVWVDGDDLLVYSRLRFGSGDMGVNTRRIDGWIAKLSAP